MAFPKIPSPDEIGSFLQGAADQAQSIAGQALDTATGTASNAAGVVAETATEAVHAAGNVADSVGEHLVGAKDNVGDLLHQARQGITGIVDGIVRNAGDGQGAPKSLDEYESAIVEYNQAYTDMSDSGTMLYQARERSGDLLGLVENLINSISNTPKEFSAAFEEVSAERANFKEAKAFAREELNAARRSAVSASGGLAAGAAVASMAPSAAIWVATTFGTASTGTAISTLSGAAASQAALAWLGGGALAAGGGGVAAGNALLAMAGPVGWGLAGASLLTSIVLFARKHMDLAQQKQEELANIKRNTTSVRALRERLTQLLDKTVNLRIELLKSYEECLGLYGKDYAQMDEADQLRLGTLVNNSKSIGALMTAYVETGDE